MAWNRLLWGVEFSSERDRFLVGQGWLYGPPQPAAYLGEPSRALLFTTRRQARVFCKMKRAQYAGRNDCCAEWKFRVRRVRERVEQVK